MASSHKSKNDKSMHDRGDSSLYLFLVDMGYWCCLLYTSNIEDQRELFDVEEFKALVKKAIVSELEPSELDAIGIVDNHLELLLVDSVGWQEEIEAVHLEILQEKINNYIQDVYKRQI